MLYATALLAFGALARAQNVLFEGDNYRGTVYYDVAGADACYQQNGGPFAANWATDINTGTPMCNGNTDTTSLNGFHSNRIVAMNVDMVRNDKAKWCGKEVQIFKDGKQITIDEGPFILWDGCAACASANIIDLSAKAFIAASGGSCGNNPEGLTVKILDNDITNTLSGGSANQGSESDLVPPSSSSSASSTTESPAQTPAGPAPGAPTDSASDNGDSNKQQGDAQDQTKDQPQVNQQIEAQPEVDSQDSNTGGEKKLNVGNYVAESPAESEKTPAATSKAAETPASSASEPKATPAPATSDDESTSPAPPSDAKADTKSGDDSTTGSDSSSSSSGSACTFGKWQCAGLELQVCNMAGQTETKWETIASCSSKCSFTTTGSAICE